MGRMPSLTLPRCCGTSVNTIPATGSERCLPPKYVLQCGSLPYAGQTQRQRDEGHAYDVKACGRSGRKIEPGGGGHLLRSVVLPRIGLLRAGEDRRDRVSGNAGSLQFTLAHVEPVSRLRADVNG